MLRAKATEFMNEGSPNSPGVCLDISSALKEAREWSELRQEEFLEKLLLRRSRSGGQASQTVPKGNGNQYKVKKEQKVNAVRPKFSSKGSGKGKRNDGAKVRQRSPNCQKELP